MTSKPKLSKPGPADVCVRVPIPDSVLNPNARSHWKKIQLAKKKLRKAARKAAANQHLSSMPWEYAAERSHFYYPTKRKRDADNSLSTLKAAFDGIVDSGILTDDSGLAHLNPVLSKDKEDPHVVIELWRMDRPRIKNPKCPQGHPEN